ncbi:MAG TPA: STAS domain-containing protein [Streptosporangiaceae bacterium]|nr:STAS domain-containing protein [Streptosporangiaceae bacterium]
MTSQPGPVIRRPSACMLRAYLFRSPRAIIRGRRYACQIRQHPARRSSWHYPPTSTTAAPPRPTTSFYAAVTGDAEVVVADFTATVFCGHWALIRLLSVQRRVAARNGQLRIVAPPGGPVFRVLEMTGLDKLLRVFPTAYHAAAAPVEVAAGSGT